MKENEEEEEEKMKKKRAEKGIWKISLGIRRHISFPPISPCIHFHAY